MTKTGKKVKNRRFKRDIEKEKREMIPLMCGQNSHNAIRKKEKLSSRKLGTVSLI